MQRLFASFCLLFLAGANARAVDLGGLEPIGSVSNFTKSANAVLFNCADGSQAQVSILAPDLVRVRVVQKIAAGARTSGWMKSGGDRVIQIADDGKAHTIQVR